ncbi:MAG TPA: LOG family protein [Gemmatimonadales bacterium]|nr:LOG family protein [Gemmatimonadales bacterium]
MNTDDAKPRVVIPTPPHPQARREPLPSETPKSPEEDPSAPGRVRAILDSPSYRPADRDLDFLARDDMRAVRLQLDYYKAERLLELHGIRHTVVVFGGTRICEPKAAGRRVAELRALLARDPANRETRRKLQIAERILAKSGYYDVAREFGRLSELMAKAAPERRTVIVTGGGPGIMEAANRGAYDVGVKSVGLNINLPQEQFPNPYVTPELCLQFHYFAMRKLHFLLRARALVAFPGGYGTFDELFETLALIQTRKIKPLPVVLVGRDYWRRAFDVDFLVDEGVIEEEDRELFWYAETAEEIWDGIRHWHAANGEPAFPG